MSDHAMPDMTTLPVTLTINGTSKNPRLVEITSADNLRDGNEAGIVCADSRSMLADRVLALRRTNIYERQMYRHIVGTPRLTGTDPAETPFLVVRTMRDGRMDLFVAGRYRDRLHNTRVAIPL